ncbi:hypothetical protein BGX24_006826 [Mortierella sp. AD032]|nr:hypothetical protein BGX24_006826 [Mortierella sp. AD032]
MYPMGSTNAAATPHINNDPDHLKPPTNTAHMDIITGVGHAKDSKSRKKKMKKCCCFFIILSIVLATVLGVLFGVILKKNSDDAGGQVE